ncbi:hypothetical protein [Nocardia testacea]|uniref:hypothetical protein n=1 Tax=Nocardia testacea TaxID=248551 RepID=UPI003A856EB3
MTDNRETASESADPDISAHRPSLLVTAHLGRSAGLQAIDLYQHAVRRFVSALSTYELAVVDGDTYLQGELASDPERRAILQFYARTLRDFDMFNSNSTFDQVAEGRFFTETFRPGPHLEVVAVTSSLTVNPWQEVYSAVTAGLGGATAAMAGWQVLKHANDILDFFIRVSTLTHERNSRIRDLRRRGEEENLAIISRLLDDLEHPDRSVAAAYLLHALLGLPQPLLETLEVAHISPEDAESRRLAILSIARPQQGD